jgi:hypothetical protein
MNNEMDFRLVITNIPKNFSDNQLKDLLDKNFPSQIGDLNIINLGHKYTKNNKVCFLSAKIFEIRKSMMDFFATFELIDQKGFKTKLNVLDCLQQGKAGNLTDPVENSIDKS